MSGATIIRKDEDTYDIKMEKNRLAFKSWYHTEKGDRIIPISSQLENMIGAIDSKIGCYKHRTITSERDVQRFIVNSLNTINY